MPDLMPLEVKPARTNLEFVMKARLRRGKLHEPKIRCDKQKGVALRTRGVLVALRCEVEVGRSYERCEGLDDYAKQKRCEFAKALPTRLTCCSDSSERETLRASRDATQRAARGSRSGSSEREALRACSVLGCRSDSSEHEALRDQRSLSRVLQRLFGAQGVARPHHDLASPVLSASQRFFGARSVASTGSNSFVRRTSFFGTRGVANSTARRDLRSVASRKCFDVVRDLRSEVLRGRVPRWVRGSEHGEKSSMVARDLRSAERCETDDYVMNKVLHP